MKKLFIIIFLFVLLIVPIVVFYYPKEQTSNISFNTISTEHVLEINSFIPNNTTKIKVSKFNNSNETPFICYVSDEKQIRNFIDAFKNIKLNTYDTIDNISPLYIIDFWGDSTSTAKISSNKILQLSTSNSSNYFKLSSEDFSTIEKLTNIKYYLHDSNVNNPSEITCYNMQKSLLAGLSNSEVTTLKTEIFNIHSSLEFYLVDRINILKNSNNIYWEPATKNEIFTQPDGVKFQSYGFWNFRDSLQNLLKLNLNDTTRDIISNIISQLQFGMDNRDLSECFEVHKMLHDLDYWIINYPISFSNIAPVDWGGIDCYYGIFDYYNF